MYNFNQKPNKYNLMSRLLHWITFFALLFQIPLGFYLVDLDFNDFRMTLEDAHVLIGITILYLTIFRLIIKLFFKSPRGDNEGFPGQKFIAKINHLLLYISIFLITISGILKKLFNGEKIDMLFFNLKIDSDFDKAELFYDIHVYSNYILISLVTLHFLAVIFHKLVLKENILKKML